LVHGPGPPGPDACGMVVGCVFQPHYGEVCNENLLRQIQGRGPWSGFRWPLVFSIAVVRELTFVSNRVAIPVSPLPHDFTGGGGPAWVHHPVFDDDAHCKHSFPPLIPCLKVHRLCNTFNLFGGHFLCRCVCGRKKDKCGGKKAPTPLGHHSGLYRRGCNLGCRRLRIAISCLLFFAPIF